MTAFLLATLTALTPLSHTSYREAYKEALESERPLIVLIGAQWCPHCHVMKPRVTAELAKNGTAQRVVFAYVDLDRQPALARQLMSGNSVPQLVSYQKVATGWRRRNLTGSQSAATVSQFIGQSLTE